MKKASTLLVLALGTVALAACTPANPATSDESTDTGNTESSSVNSTAQGLSVTLGSNSIVKGQNFIDAVKPSVIYTADGESLDVTYYTYLTDYFIYDVTDRGTFIEKDASLAPGNYAVKVSYNNVTSEAINFTVRDEDPVAGSEGNGYHTPENFDDYALEKYTNIGALGDGKYPSKGDRKILVIPVIFEGMSDFTEEDIQVIHNAYFGEASDTGWESLASYYEKSSYGQLHMTGEVTPQFKYSKTPIDFERGGNGGVQTLLSEAVRYIRDNCPSVNVDSYDTNNDGWLDGVELVYRTTRPNKSQDGADIWWNFTSCTSASPNKSAPTAKRFFWSLFDYIKNGYFDPNIDCHTLVHETGHMLGLNDYYSYDQDEGVCGGSDMMDFNVGDHNAYSKMMLNWITPKVVDGTNSNFTITLDPYEKNGDCILLRNTTTDPWNGTPYDEYLVLQYYTPTGLNKGDSKGYAEWQQTSASGGSAYGHGGTYEKPGLQVFHVDSRLFHSVKDNDTGKTYVEYTDVLSNTGYTEGNKTYGASDMAASNTGTNVNGDGSVDIKATNEKGTTVYDCAFREISCVAAGGMDNLSGSSFFNTFGFNQNLFSTQETQVNPDTGKTEKVWGGSTDFYSNYNYRNFFKADIEKGSWNDGSTLNWSFKILEQTFDEETEDGSMTIQFIETK